MADALGLGPSGAIRGGSSPFSRTRLEPVVYGVRLGVRLDSKSLPAVSSDEVRGPRFHRGRWQGKVAGCGVSLILADLRPGKSIIQNSRLFTNQRS